MLSAGDSIETSLADPSGAVCLEGDDELRVHCQNLRRESSDSGSELCNGGAVTCRGRC